MNHSTELGGEVDQLAEFFSLLDCLIFIEDAFPCEKHGRNQGNGRHENDSVRDFEIAHKHLGNPILMMFHELQR